MINLKPLFKNLKEIEKPVFKKEWTERDFEKVNTSLKNLFLFSTLADHRGNKKTMYSLSNIEDLFGLPYTSSSSYAMISNTNTLYHIDIEENYNIELFALTEDNKVILEVGDKEENTKYFVIG